MWASLTLSLVAALSFSGVRANAPDGLSDTEVTGFLTSVQDAVRDKKPTQVAALVKFPLRVGYSSKSTEQPARVVVIRDSSEFVRRYSEIFTPEVRAAVLAQSPGNLFRNWQGVMVGNGELWYAGVCKDARCSEYKVRIISINVIK